MTRTITYLLSMFEDELPDVYVRGAGLYKTKLNAENPVGTVQSIEYALRSLHEGVTGSEEYIAKLEKQQRDYQDQANKPFEHESKLKDLLARQAQLNAALDLDKGEKQIAEDAKSETTRQCRRRCNAPRRASHRIPRGLSSLSVEFVPFGKFPPCLLP